MKLEIRLRKLFVTAVISLVFVSLTMGSIVYAGSNTRLGDYTIEDALDKVSELRGVRFKWIDKSSGNKPEVGLIAQEVEKVIPEVVFEDDEGIKSVAYDKIVGILIEAVKELKAENEAVKKDNIALRAEKDTEIATLKAENMQLRDNLTDLADRQAALEYIFLAISTAPTKEKLATLNQAGLDEALKTIQ